MSKNTSSQSKRNTADLFAENSELREKHFNGDAATDITTHTQAEEKLRQSEERFRLASDAAAALVYDVDLTGTRKVIAHGIERVTGYTNEESELSREWWHSLIHPEDLPAHLENYEKQLKNGGKYVAVYRLRCKDGAVIWVEDTAQVVKDETGANLQLVGTVVDITTRKRAEETLRESEATAWARTAELESLLTAAPLGMGYFDRQHRYLRINDELAAINGIPAAAHIGKTIEELLPETAGAVTLVLDRVFETGEIFSNLEVTGETPRQPGIIRHWLTGFFPVRDEHSEVTSVGVWVAEITERKRHEEQLRVNEERLSLAMKGANIGTFDWNIKTGEIEWSGEIIAAAGMSAADFENSFEGFTKLIHPLDRERVEGCIAEAMKDGDYECEFRMLRGDGSIRWVIAKGRVFFDDEGTPARLVGVDIDITKRKFAEDDLLENQRFTNSIIETAPSILYTFELETQTNTYLTGQAAKVLGYSFEELKEANSSFLVGFMHPDDIKKATKHFEQIAKTGNGKVFEFEYRMRHKSGEWRWFRSRDKVFKLDENGKPSEILGIALDITERKQAEIELRESDERMRLATEATQVGVWEWNVITTQIRWDAQMFRIYGIEPTENGFVPYTAWSESVLPEELSRQEELLQKTLREGGHVNREFRIRRNNDGAIRYIQAVETVRLNDEGQPEWVVGTNLDVTTRRLAEDALRASEEFNRSVLENSPDCVKILDDGGRLEFMNTNGLCLLEIDDFAPFQNKFWWEMWTDEAQPAVKESIEKALRGEIANFQAFTPTAKGTPKWWDVIVSPIPGVDGKPSRLISVSRDITESKHRELNLAFLADLQKDFAPLLTADKILRVAGERIAAYLNLTNCSFVEINEAMDTAHVAHDQHTADAIDLAGVYPMKDFHSAEERAEMLAGRSIVINDTSDMRETEAAARFDALGIRALLNAPYVSDGRWRFVLCAMCNAPRVWRNDEIALLNEIAARLYIRIERARAEADLRESEERYRTLFDSIDEGFCIIEVIFNKNNKPFDYRFVQVNPAMERLTGLKDAVGKTMREFVPDLEEFWFETYGKVALTGEAVRFENFAEPMNRWFEVYASRLGDSRNRVAVVFNNITERKLSEQDREESFKREQILRREAEHANVAKDEFLAVLSHELRSPLNAMLGWATMLKSGSLNEEMQRQAIGVIERNIRLQNALIEDLLDVSRIISGKMRLEPERISFVPIVQNALHTAHPAADAKNIKLETEFNSAADEMDGDAHRLQQIIGNLLTNAIKFTPENGTISIRLECADETARLTITDSGIGIGAELLPHVFERFQQADGSTKRQFGGLGLGLTIVKYLTEMHDGRVFAASEGAGKGSTFTVELPLVKAYKAKESVPAAGNVEKHNTSEAKILANVKLLIVDDDADALDLLRFVLEQEGAQVVCAGSVGEALTQLQDDKFDLLISDLGMAGTDGYDLIRRVRASENKDIAVLPAIALTGYVSTEDRERVLLAGFQTHLSKPLDIDKLFAVVRDLIEADVEKSV